MWLRASQVKTVDMKIDKIVGAMDLLKKNEWMPGIHYPMNLYRSIQQPEIRPPVGRFPPTLICGDDMAWRLYHVQKMDCLQGKVAKKFFFQFQNGPENPETLVYLNIYNQL